MYLETKYTSRTQTGVSIMSSTHQKSLTMSAQAGSNSSGGFSTEGSSSSKVKRPPRNGRVIVSSRRIGKYVSRTIGHRIIERDPLLDDVVSILLNSGLSIKAISFKSGVSVKTLYSWINGNTYRPQRATMEMALRVCGKTLIIADLGADVKPLFSRRKR